MKPNIKLNGWFVWPSICLLLALLVTLLLLFTASGRAQLVKFSVAAVNQFTNQTLVVEGFDSPTVKALRADKIDWRSGDVHWQLNDLSLTIDSLSLLGQQLAISTLHVGSIQQKSAGESDETGIQLPNITELWPSLPAIRIDNVKARLLLTEQSPIDIDARLAINQPKQALAFVGQVNNEQWQLSSQINSVSGKTFDTNTTFWFNDVLTPSQPYSLAARISPAKQWRISISQAMAERFNVNFGLTGDVMLGSQLTQFELSNLNVSLNDHIIKLDGQLSANRSDIELSAQGLPISLLDHWLPDTPANGVVDINGSLSGGWQQPFFDGYIDLIGQLYGQPLDVYTQTSSDFGRYTIEQGWLRWGDAAIDLTAQLDEQMQLTGELAWSSLSLAQLPQLAINQSMSMTTSGELTVSGELTAPVAKGKLNAFGRYNNEPYLLSGNISSLTQNALQANGVNISSGQNRLSAEGVVDWQQFELDISANIEQLASQLIASFAPLPEVLNTLNLAGNLRLTGALNDPTAQGELRVQGIVERNEISASATFEALSSRGIQLTSATLTPESGSLSINGSAQWQDLSINLSGSANNIGLAIAKPYLSSLPLKLDQLTGKLDGNFSLVGTPELFDAQGQLTLRGNYLAKPYQATWQGQGSWPDDSQHELALSYSDSELNLDAQLNRSTLVATLTWPNLSIADTRMLGLAIPSDIEGNLSGQLRATGDLDNPQIWFTNYGRGNIAQKPWQLDTQGNASRQGLDIQSFEIDMAEQGQLSATGQLSASSYEFDAQLNLPDIAYWLGEDSQYSGSLTSELSLSGTETAPEVSGALTWQSDLYPVGLTSQVQTQAEQFRLIANLTSNNRQGISLNLMTPQLPLTELSNDLSARPFEAELAFQTNATALAPFFRRRPEQAFQGSIDGGFTISGPAIEPTWQGELTLKNGYYANALYGTVLQDIDLAITAADLDLNVAAQAKDNNGGKLSLAGDINWFADRSAWWLPNLDLALTSDSARLVRRTDIDATASGSLNVSGEWQDLLVAGDIEVIPLTIRLVDNQTNIAQLNIVEEVNEAPSQTLQDSPFTPDGRWQVSVKANQRAQIYMLGLQADLRGQVELSDALLSPVVGGQFSVVRGNYTAFGKIFEIEQGDIRIQGSQLTLDILARYDGLNIGVDLRITGTQDRIELALSSDDNSRSSDEILTELLFGKRLEELSPIEAVQLAAAANSLRGTSQDLGFFGDTRDFFGLDALTLNPSIDGEGDALQVNVRAGKYLSNQIYLEVETNVGPESSTTGSLQWQLTPNSNLELYTGEEARSGGIQFQWQKDY